MNKTICTLLMLSLTAACGGIEEPSQDVESQVRRQEKPDRYVCTRSGITVMGICEDSPNSSLYPECDDAWKFECESGGLQVDPCSDGQCAGSVNCVDNSVLFHDCDKEFSTGCKDAGGTFTCTDWFGDECREGTCKIP